MRKSRSNEIAPKPGLQFGASIKAVGRKAWELGIIVDYSPASRTYKVRTASGLLPNEVPRLLRDPGDISIIPRDTTVVMHDELGFLVIDSILPQAPSQPVELAPAHVTEIRGIGGEDPIYQADEDAAKFRQPNEPGDLLAGDRVISSKEGNLIGILSGGTNVIKSSPLAQIRTHSLTDMVEVISNVYRHISALGDLKITNINGRTSLIWRAGANQQNENGPGEENWTIRLDAGASGDLFNLEVTTPDGKTLSKIHMSADGRLDIMGLNGIDVTTGPNGSYREDIGGNKISHVQGDTQLTVDGNKQEKVEGAADIRVSNNTSLIVGNDLSETIGHNHTSFVVGSVNTKIQGGPSVPPPKPNSIAYKIETINGGVEMVLGSPISGALPLQQSANFVNYAGGYNFVVQPTAMPPPIGGFNVITSTPNSVMLGATGAAVYNPKTLTHTIKAVAPFGVMKFEPFASLLSTLLTWLDTHTHATAVGPTTPPLIPSTPMISPQVPTIRSVRVSVGL